MLALLPILCKALPRGWGEKAEPLRLLRGTQAERGQVMIARLHAIRMLVSNHIKREWVERIDVAVSGLVIE